MELRMAPILWWGRNEDFGNIIWAAVSNLTCQLLQVSYTWANTLIIVIWANWNRIFCFSFKIALSMKRMEKAKSIGGVMVSYKSLSFQESGLFEKVLWFGISCESNSPGWGLLFGSSKPLPKTEQGLSKASNVVQKWMVRMLSLCTWFVWGVFLIGCEQGQNFLYLTKSFAAFICDVGENSQNDTFRLFSNFWEQPKYHDLAKCEWCQEKA